ncbi:hypothetical protein ACH82I_03470 [Brevibacterium sp. GP-SGM9]|uniref:hypothetical protein n=1 Tax=Brevibacterium sp. GP-SGM9 TaxID=3376990 RepID=UPI0039A5FFD4
MRFLRPPSTFEHRRVILQIFEAQISDPAQDIVIEPIGGSFVAAEVSRVDVVFDLDTRPRPGSHMERKVVAREELDERFPVGALRVDAVQRYAHAYRLEAPAAATAGEAAEGSRQVSIEDDPFDYQVTKSGVLIIRRGGRAVRKEGCRPDSEARTK